MDFGVLSVRLRKMRFVPTRKRRVATLCFPKLLLLAGSVDRQSPAEAPVTNEKGNGSYAEQQYWNRSQAIRFKVGEIGEGIPGWIKWVIKDDDRLSDPEFLPPGLSQPM